MGPNPPKGIRATCSTTAAAYALTTKARSTGPLRRPDGNARNRCRNSTGGKRSNAWPRVNVRSFVVHESVEMKFAKPTATISAPNRLSGRRHHANKPHRTYDAVSQFERRAITSGSPRSAPTAGFRNADVNEYAAPAQPARAMAPRASGRSVARAARGSASSGAVAGTAVTCLPSFLGAYDDTPDPPETPGRGLQEEGVLRRLFPHSSQGVRGTIPRVRAGGCGLSQVLMRGS